MTGRDLIIYILSNHLEDEPLYQDGYILGFLSCAQAAAKFDVGENTVYLWYRLGWIDGVEIGDKVYIPINAKPKNGEQ